MFPILLLNKICIDLILMLKLPVLVGPLSAIQPPFDINFRWSLI